MNITLYELTAEYREAAERLSNLDLDESTIADTLEGLKFPLEQKAANVAMFARNLEATADAIKQAEGEMAKRRKAIEHRASSIRAYLLANMQNAGISKVETPQMVLSIRQNPASVVIDAESQIPQEFMRQPEPPPPAPDKKAIADAIKSGMKVPGAHLSNSVRLEIK